MGRGPSFTILRDDRAYVSLSHAREVLFGETAKNLGIYLYYLKLLYVQNGARNLVIWTHLEISSTVGVLEREPCEKNHPLGPPILSMTKTTDTCKM